MMNVCDSSVIEEYSSDAVPDIIDSLPLDFDYKSVTDRYYSRRYCINVKGTPKNDHLLLFHSNRICVVTLAPSHPLFKKDVDYSVNFKIGNVDRTKNAVKGKGKKGGQIVSPNSTLCVIKCTDGTQYDVSSCISGKLMEVNQVLVDNPSLLKSHPDSNGFVAIVLSNISVSDSRKEELLTEKDYLSTVS